LPTVKTPLILLNFKTFQETTGKNAVRVAKIAERASLETGVCIIVAPQFVDILRVSQEVSIPVFAQHIDPITPGPYTGHILPEAVKEAGAVGAIINHSEREITITTIHKAVERAREVGLLSLICCSTDPICAASVSLHPDMLALEPPELIGTPMSVSRAKPHSIVRLVEAIKNSDYNIIPLCGAGVRTKNDVKIALQLGAKGVIVGSAVKSKNLYGLLLDMAEAAVEIEDEG